MIYFYTTNKNKIKEAQEILGEPIRQNKKQLTEIQEIDLKKVLSHKFRQIKTLQRNFIVEDTALYLGKNREIGAMIKWFRPERIAKAFLGETAIAVCGIGYQYKDKRGFLFGEIKGTITEMRGKNGFGWDCVFRPDNFNKTFAKMTNKEKNKTSPRYKVLMELKQIYLKNL